MSFRKKKPLLEITFNASVVKGITKQCLTGIWAKYDLLDLQTQILPLAFILEQYLCLKVGPTNHKLISYQVNNCILSIM